MQVTVSGFESVYDDLSDIMRELNNQIDVALIMVGSEMIHNLQEHIQEDVYEAYSPKRYPRRSENPRFGRSLIDDSLENMRANVKNSRLDFYYTPTGAHSGTMGDVLNASDFDFTPNGAAKPLKPHPVHGNDLIKLIQSGEGYDWDVKVGARPFWDRFVDEQLNDKILNTFIANMKPNFTVEMTAEDIIADGTEKDL